MCSQIEQEETMMTNWASATRREIARKAGWEDSVAGVGVGVGVGVNVCIGGE